MMDQNQNPALVPSARISALPVTDANGIRFSDLTLHLGGFSPSVKEYLFIYSLVTSLSHSILAEGHYNQGPVEAHAV